jgi:membrane protein EpsK
MFGMGISLWLGFWFTPYLIHHLGKAQYGLVPLANTVISYMGVATAGISVAVSRFVTIALERDDLAKANRLFNTAQIGLWGISLALIVPVLLVSYFGDHLVRVPAGSENDVRWLFLFCGASFLFATATSAFEVSTFCRNRLDILGWFSIMSAFVRVGFVLLLFQIIAARLWQVGAGIALAALISGLGFVWTWRHLTPDLHIKFSDWDVTELRRLTATAGWVSVSQVGTILLIGIDLLVVNRIFGPVANTQYAVALQWSMMLRGIAITLSVLFAPKITALHACGNVDGLVNFSLRSVKFMGLLMALPIGLVSGLSRPLLQTWLGQDFVGIAPLMILLTLPLALNLAYLPLHQISLATNDVHIPGLVQIAAGALNLVLAVVLARYTPLGMYGVALAGGLVLSLRNLLFTPIYAARIIRVPDSTFFRAMSPCLIASGIAFGAAWLGGLFFSPAGWLRLGATAAVASLVYAATSYLLLLSKPEQQEVNQRSLGYIQRILRQ